jgi:hypothetical protein
LFWKLTFTVTQAFVTGNRGQSLRHRKLELDLELHVLVIDDASRCVRLLVINDKQSRLLQVRRREWYNYSGTVVQILVTACTVQTM